MLSYVVCNLGDVRIVESCINFVQDEERRWLIAARPFEQKSEDIRTSRTPMDSEKQG